MAKNKQMYTLTDRKLVHLSVLNVYICRFYADLKFNFMKNLITIIAALIVLAFIVDAQAQKEQKKVIKKVFVTDDGKVVTETDTIEMDVDIDVEEHDGFSIIKLNGDSIVTITGHEGEDMVWVNDGKLHKQIKIKKMHHHDGENMDVIIERIIGEHGDSIEKEVKVFMHKLPGDGKHMEFFDGKMGFPPPPPPPPHVEFKHFKHKGDALQQLLDDPEYEVIKFEKKIKNGVEKIQIERKKK